MEWPNHLRKHSCYLNFLINNEEQGHGLSQVLFHLTWLWFLRCSQFQNLKAFQLRHFQSLKELANSIITAIHKVSWYPRFLSNIRLFWHWYWWLILDFWWATYTNLQGEDWLWEFYLSIRLYLINLKWSLFDQIMQFYQF